MLQCGERMNERTSTREILNRTHEVFFRHFGKLVAPALIAGFLSYWANYAGRRMEHLIVGTLGGLFHGEPRALVMVIIIPVGVARVFVVWGVQLTLWGLAFAAVSQMVVSSGTAREVSPGNAVRTLVREPGWPALLQRLFWRLAVPGYVISVVSGVAGSWAYPWAAAHTWMPRVYHLDESQAQFAAQVFLFLLFGLIYLIYARRFLLAIPCPIAAGDEPVDPFIMSAQASRPWRVAIIGFCLVVWMTSGLGDSSLPLRLLGPGMIRPSLISILGVQLGISLLTSVPWAWLFVFLTEIAIDAEAGENPVIEMAPADAL